MDYLPVSAREQMEYQTYMSNTAHQREVADLQAAGLNPVLSAHTQGASTPSGASDSLADIMRFAESVSNSALSLAKDSIGAVKSASKSPATFVGGSSVQSFPTSGSSVDNFVKGYIDSLPDKGDAFKLFGVHVSNSSLKYILNQAYDWFQSLHTELPPDRYAAAKYLAGISESGHTELPPDRYAAAKYLAGISESGRSHGGSAGSFARRRSKSSPFE